MNPKQAHEAALEAEKTRRIYGMPAFQKAMRSLHKELAPLNAYVKEHGHFPPDPPFLDQLCSTQQSSKAVKRP